MSYSSSFGLNYQPNETFNFSSPPTFPYLTNSSTASQIPVANSGLLTNSATGGVAVPFVVSSYRMPTGIWALRFQVSLIIAGDVQPSNIYLLIQPSNGSSPISNCVMNSGTPAAGTYNYSIDMVIAIIGDSNDPTVGNTIFQVVGFWAGDGTITVDDPSGASYVKLA